MYEPDKLREYIENSEIRKFSITIKIRLAKELAKKYDLGGYKRALQSIQENYNLITKNLKPSYPGKAKPILYIYIVPDSDYIELLHFPKKFIRSNGGGKTVMCYDLDGFNSAYGLSQNMLENKNEEQNIAKKVNEIHELAHIIHNQYFYSNLIICEGFAETIPLYILELEKNFQEYNQMLRGLNKNDILSAEDLLKQENNDTFGRQEILPNKTCSFRLSYVSSYLFVRGCIEKIEVNNKIDKVHAALKFLEIIRNSNFRNEWLVFSIADTLQIDRDELLNGKGIQLRVLSEICRESC